MIFYFLFLISSFIFSSSSSSSSLLFSSLLSVFALYHTPIPGPTRLVNPNRVRGARPYIGTIYLIFFPKPNLYLWVWPTSYNIIKISYSFTESHLQLQNCTFTFTNQSTEPTCSEPLQVCWPSCMQMLSDVFFCTYTD